MSETMLPIAIGVTTPDRFFDNDLLRRSRAICPDDFVTQFEMFRVIYEVSTQVKRTGIVASFGCG